MCLPFVIAYICDLRFGAIFKSVDFPQPEGPTMVTNSPLLRSKDIFFRASVPSGKIIPMSSNESDEEVFKFVFKSLSHLVLSGL